MEPKFGWTLITKKPVLVSRSLKLISRFRLEAVCLKRTICHTIFLHLKKKKKEARALFKFESAGRSSSV